MIKILRQVRELQSAIDKAKTWGDVAKNAKAAQLAIGNASSTASAGRLLRRLRLEAAAAVTEIYSEIFNLTHRSNKS